MTRFSTWWDQERKQWSERVRMAAARAYERGDNDGARIGFALARRLDKKLEKARKQRGAKRREEKD